MTTSRQRANAKVNLMISGGILMWVVFIFLLLWYPIGTAYVLVCVILVACIIVSIRSILTLLPILRRRR